MEIITCCPRCKARTEEEAQEKCIPGRDECPMDGDWEACLDYYARPANSTEQNIKG